MLYSNNKVSNAITIELLKLTLRTYVRNDQLSESSGAKLLYVQYVRNANNRRNFFVRTAL